MHLSILMAATAVVGGATLSAPPETPLPPAVLVLTDELCTAQKVMGDGWITAKEKFPAGELLCPAFESKAKEVFSDVTVAKTAPAPGTAAGKLVLIPKYISLEATRTMSAFGQRSIVLLVEWTATDDQGKAIWIQTVQGERHEKSGNSFTWKSHSRKLLAGAVDDTAAKSFAALQQAPEIQNLAGTVSSATGAGRTN